MLPSEHTMPELTMPEHTMPEHTMPQHTMPQHTMPEHTMPEHTRTDWAGLSRAFSLSGGAVFSRNSRHYNCNSLIPISVNQSHIPPPAQPLWWCGASLQITSFTPSGM